MTQLAQNPEEFDLVVLGSGEGGKYIAWTQGREGKRVAMIERQLRRRILPQHRLPAEQERDL